MLRRTLLPLMVILAVAVSACGEGQPETCDEIADETVKLVQDLIDDVERELGDVSIEELLASGGDLPSVESYEEDSAKIDERAAELGCTPAEIQSGVAARANELEADTPIGRFLIEAMRSGGL